MPPVRTIKKKKKKEKRKEGKDMLFTRGRLIEEEDEYFAHKGKDRSGEGIHNTGRRVYTTITQLDSSLKTF